METREEDVFDNESAKVSSTCFVGTVAFVEKICFICNHLLCLGHLQSDIEKMSVALQETDLELGTSKESNNSQRASLSDPKEVVAELPTNKDFHLSNTHDNHQNSEKYSQSQIPIEDPHQSVLKWRTDVSDILPWSQYNRGEVTPCGKFFICHKGKLYSSYEHMNAVQREVLKAKFKASVENQLCNYVLTLFLFQNDT